MTDLITRDFDGASVRLILDTQGEPVWVAADVARVLGYANPQEAIREHCKGVSEMLIPTAGGPQRVNVIPERDLYRLVMRSRLPSAQRFEEWVVGDVLPSIRRTGGYGIETLDLRDPKALAPLALKLAQLVQEQQEQLALAAPKVEAFDGLMTAEGSYSLSDAAKVLGWGPRRLMLKLEADGYVFRRSERSALVAKQEHIDAGLFTTRTGTYGNDDERRVFVQARLTAKGLDHFRQKYANVPELLS